MLKRDEDIKKLDEYIRYCLSQGKNEIDIKKELSACGWPEEYIEDSFNFLKKEKEDEDGGELNIKKFLMIIDNLLAKLPEEVKEDFIYSKDFEFYKNILKKYGVK